MHVLWARAQIATQPDVLSRGLLWGGVLGAGLQRPLGPGLAFAEAEWNHSGRSTLDGVFSVDARRLGLALGYRLRVW